MSFRRILPGVILAHIVILLALTLLSGGRKFEVSKVAPVSLLETTDPEPAAEQQPPAEKVPPPEKPPPPEKAPPDREKVIKKIPAPVSFSSHLKERLQERLSRIESSSPRKAPAPSSGLKSRGFNFPWYNSYLYNKIYNLWQEPSQAAVKQSRARALVSFRVYRDGHIESIALKSSSGSKLMDETVLQAVRMADPLPPFPETFRGSHHDFELLFTLSRQTP